MSVQKYLLLEPQGLFLMSLQKHLQKCPQTFTAQGSGEISVPAEVFLGRLPMF